LRFFIRIVLVGISCLAIALGFVAWMTGFQWMGTTNPPAPQARARAAEPPNPLRETFPDPNAEGAPLQVFTERVDFDGDIFSVTAPFMPPIRDPQSLQELSESRRSRGRTGITALRNQFDELPLNSPPTFQQVMKALPLARSIAFLYMHEGKFSEAIGWLERALGMCQTSEFSPDIAAGVHVLLGITALRGGEIENCLECMGPSSCIFPIEHAAIHHQQAGSRRAVEEFKRYLEWAPGDLRARWLLSVAYMTLGEYPEKVPRAYLIPLDKFRSKLDVGRFENVAPRVGLGVRGPNLAGGSIFDDFNGDGLPDLFITSIDADAGASLFINRGDGTFEDRSAAAGLGSQIYVLNVVRADYDNDGDLDVLLLRGAWEKPTRLSLLQNHGGKSFEDVTIASGLGELISSESAAWGDYDNDGRLDLFLCGEYHTGAHGPTDLSRLYHNEGNGKFKNVAAAAGIENKHVSKGSGWGDYDGDGRLDLFVSNYDGPCRLYHNEGNGSFVDVAPQLGLEGPARYKSFSCWFWDFDNDGKLDLLVNDYHSMLGEVIAYYCGLTGKDPGHPRLYRNLGDKGFEDVSRAVGLDWPIPAMGANMGDIDNDGYLDVYFGTGEMAYSGLMPNVMLKNLDGRRFEDVTDSSRTGHLQKGHGVSFADYDSDGDLDLFVQLGGAYPGDQAYNVLFQNPGHGHHWLKVKLVGTTTNRSALGARIKADLKTAGGATRSIYRTIGNNGSFGGNSLTETIGLAKATSVDDLTIAWPTSKTTQTFRNLAADQSIEITEGASSFRVVNPPRSSTAPPSANASGASSPAVAR
jgi:hypothetical protein